MEMLQGVWKQHLRPRAVVGYGVKIVLPSPPNYVTRSAGKLGNCKQFSVSPIRITIHAPGYIIIHPTHIFAQTIT